ncbi:DNA-binding protein [Roseateles sp. SL47]|uniref:helix-turn-helix transcriptional regulator n=1 Tax=Roseateles sp. SL47 TaxID=2995138 RepID=UPI0022722AA9|nr:DNA-binding protein [Roseateles sp. SL47]WAC75860.1 DNA-binding protein [Roseateles sp. SL47]
MEFAFTLKYQLSRAEGHQREVVERLMDTGCGDALIRNSPPGRLSLAFHRAAESPDEALMSALKDIRSSLPAARLIEAGPDLVGLTDVAELVGVTRQNMRKLMLTHMASFPPPVHEGNASSVWHLSHVLAWMASRGGYVLDPSVVGMSRTAMQVNLIKEQQHLDRGDGEAVLRALVL